ncbi:MAG: signal recognition particle-docking protein FtsY [Puniceicoccales bacterium]|jgi:fused signal recognition particle receptor|nr:signal recognition particle-docking protein FtsY [Puniceicoccales bacterium]
MFGFFAKVRSGFESTKNRLTATLKSIFQGKKLDQNTLGEIEALLYAADVGVETTQYIITSIQNAYKNDPHIREQEVRTICKNVLLEVLRGADRPPNTLFQQPNTNQELTALASGDGEVSQNKILPTVICLIGTNGSGKTTTAAKLASFFRKNGQSVIVGACDTFRAAANEQIKIWSERLNFDLVESRQGADAASVAFDTCQAAIHRGREIVILDTAGRLHNKSNLMAELVKLKKVVCKVSPEFPQHTWLVIDGNLGANTITSAWKFHEALKLTGVIVTKLDGTSRGGALIGIYRQLEIPIYFVGIGEKYDDLVPFAVDEYIRAFF